MNTLMKYAGGVSEGFCALALPLVIQSFVVLTLVWIFDRAFGQRLSTRGRYRLWVGGLLGSVLPFSWLLPIPKVLHAHGDYPILTIPVAIILAWLIGMAVLGWTALRRALRLQVIARQAGCASGFMQGVFRYCRNSMSVHVGVCLKVSSKVESPVVWGVWQPVILLPHDFASRFGSRGLRAVLLHQFARIKNGDLRINFLQVVMQIVWFFNPLIWLANGRIRALRSCLANELVLEAMDNRLPWYPETLADMAAPATENPGLTAALVGV